MIRGEFSTRDQSVRGTEGGAFSLLTAYPGPNVGLIHARQPAALDRDAWGARG